MPELAPERLLIDGHEVSPEAYAEHLAETDPWSLFGLDEDPRFAPIFAEEDRARTKTYAVS